MGQSLSPSIYLRYLQDEHIMAPSSLSLILYPIFPSQTLGNVH